MKWWIQSSDCEWGISGESNPHGRGQTMEEWEDNRRTDDQVGVKYLAGWNLGSFDSARMYSIHGTEVMLLKAKVWLAGRSVFLFMCTGVDWMGCVVTNCDDDDDQEATQLSSHYHRVLPCNAENRLSKTDMREYLVSFVEEGKQSMNCEFSHHFPSCFFLCMPPGSKPDQL